MAWSTPMTAVSGTTFSASQFNQFIRDNLNETMPAKAANVSGYFVSTSSTNIVQRQTQSAIVTTAQSTSSTSYTDLGTFGPQVSTATGSRALVIITAQIRNDTQNAFSHMSYAVSGATTESAVTDQDKKRLSISASIDDFPVIRHSAFTLQDLNPGTNTFTMKYRVNAGTATFDNREITVIPF